MRDLNRIPADFDEQLYKKCEILSHKMFSDDLSYAQEIHKFSQIELDIIKKNNINRLYNLIKYETWWNNNTRSNIDSFVNSYINPIQYSDSNSIRITGREERPLYYFDTIE